MRLALEVGYRHLDTAEQYGTEAEVGAGLVDSGVPRGEVFLTSKYQSLHVDAVSGKQGCGFGMPGDLLLSLNASLARLNTLYVDVYLSHYPTPVAASKAGLSEVTCGGRPLAERRAMMWRDMMHAQRLGLARMIGVSNWAVEELAELEPFASPPRVYQGEWSPFFHDEALHTYLKEHAMAFVGYGALLRPLMVDWWGATKASRRFRANFEAIATRLGVSTVQVLLSYSVQRGVAVITRSTKRAHLIANLNRSSVLLTPADLALMDSAPQLPKGYGHDFGAFRRTAAKSAVRGKLPSGKANKVQAEVNMAEVNTQKAEVNTQKAKANAEKANEDRPLSSLSAQPRAREPVAQPRRRAQSWRVLESLDGRGDDLDAVHKEPMRAVTTGELACVVVRSVLTPRGVSDVLQRLRERELWTTGGQLGAGARRFNAGAYRRWRSYPFLSEIGQTIHSYGGNTRAWGRAAHNLRHLFSHLFADIVDPFEMVRSTLTRLARGSGKVVAPPTNFTLEGAPGTPGMPRELEP